MQLFLTDTICEYHYDCMGYIPTLLQESQISNQLWMQTSHQNVQRRFTQLHQRNETLTRMPTP